MYLFFIEIINDTNGARYNRIVRATDEKCAQAQFLTTLEKLGKLRKTDRWHYSFSDLLD